MQANHQVVLRLDAKQAKILNTIVTKSVGKAEWNLMNEVELSTLKLDSEVRLADGKARLKF